MAPPAFAAADVHVALGGRWVLRGAWLTVPDGALVALVGTSGSGKTTLLRCFNRLLQPDTGEIRVAGTDIRTLDPVQLRRQHGYVPQDGGLLPHWTVLRNVALSCRLLGQPDAEARARHALHMAGLEPSAVATRLPHELSGGQRQRVALARATAAGQPRLLLDEPFSALDRIGRAALQRTLLALREDRPLTGLLVTHDLHEAALLGDLIAVMRQGLVEQCGTLATLLGAPASAYVAELLAPLRATGDTP